MFNVGVPELLVITVVALVVLGPDRIPDAARQAGRLLADARRWSTTVEREVRTMTSAVERELRADDGRPPSRPSPPVASQVAAPSLDDER